MVKKKITLKSNNGDELYPLTVVQQVEGLKEALDNKLGKTEKAADSLLADVARNVSNGAITQSKIGDGSVTTSKIAKTAVTSTKIENDVMLNGT
ncbi:MAG: hypothetical protein II371_06185, partial [Flavobacteriales bacterium]|nr:hypothetical protein [Flavobacteriales bacterium]